MNNEKLTFWYRFCSISGLLIFIDIFVLRMLGISGFFGTIIYPILESILGEDSEIILLFIGIYMSLWPLLLIVAFVLKNRLNKLAVSQGREEELEKTEGFSKFTWILIYLLTFLVVLGFISAFLEA